MPKELDRGGKMNEHTEVCFAENSVTGRVNIIAHYESMVGVLERLDGMPIRLALDNLDAVIEEHKRVLTLLDALRRWANQPTRGVNIPF